MGCSKPIYTLFYFTSQTILNFSSSTPEYVIGSVAVTGQTEVEIRIPAAASSSSPYRGTQPGYSELNKYI